MQTEARSVQTEARSVPLFKNTFLERLTHVHHNTPFFIFSPMIAFLLLHAFLGKGFGFTAIAAGFAGGLLVWTLFEYLLHRFIFHYQPKTDFGKRTLYLFHGVHHDFPREADRLVMPPVTSLPIAGGVFLLHMLIGGTASLPFFCGFVTGYLYYEFVHYSVHFKQKRPWLWTPRQRKDHLQHHFKDAEKRFGVTSPLWDWVFRTY